MLITVVIPTYRRPKDLERCLKALKEQTRQADEILIVVRDSDEETRIFIDKIKTNYANLRLANVLVSGQVAALNTGLDNAKGDIIAFTDDDCVPYPDWLSKIEAHFNIDSKIGAAGGRDRVFIEGKEITNSKLQAPCPMPKVGIITWYGRIIGNTHLGVGEARGADHLKGANMSFRRQALEGIRFDEQLRGEGAQYRNDLALCLAMKRRGWKIIYDPQIVIDHYYATRFEEDQRGNFDLTAIENAAYNEMYIFLKYLHNLQKFTCIIYAFLIGSKFTPGICQWLRLALTGQKNPWLRFCAAQRGRWQSYSYKS